MPFPSAASSTPVTQGPRSLTDFRARLKPLDDTDQQLREFRQVDDAIPWNDVEDALHTANVDRPALPNYAGHVDRTASQQEDSMVAFQELFTAPAIRHGFSLALAAFIDIICASELPDSTAEFSGP